MTEYTGWAIEARSSGPLADIPRLRGRYYMQKCEIPPHMEGHRIALFKTRALARAAAGKRWSVGDTHHWYVPVKVQVVITVVGREAARKALVGE